LSHFVICLSFFFFSSRRRHTRCLSDWSSDVCSSDLIRAGIYRLQADKVTDYEAKNLVVAEGNVVFDQGEFQRITGSRAEWNYATKTGYFLNSTGFTNQTQDGTIIYFTADRVEKVSGSKIVVLNAEVTACGDDEVP